MDKLRNNPHNFNPRVLYIMRRIFNAKDDIESHSHDFLSIIYILEGNAKYEIGGKIYPVCPGTLFVCNPKTTHHRIIEKNQCIEEFQVGVSCVSIKGLPENYLIPETEEPKQSLIRYGQAFSNCIGEIVLEQQKNEEAGVLMLKCLVMKLLVYIMKERFVSPKPVDKNVFELERYDKKVMVNNIVSFINDNYMKSISLAKISESTYLSPIYVSKVFKEMTGESPINYLIRIRLLKACELLENKEIPIKEIAGMVGYEDAYYFSKLFKKYFGMSPLPYRKLKTKPVFKIPATQV